MVVELVTTMTMTTIFDNNNVTSSSPGRYVLEEEEVSEAPPPPLPDVVYNGTGYYIDGETEGKNRTIEMVRSLGGNLDCSAV